MNKKQREQLMSEWVASIVLFEAGSREIGETAWLQSAGMMVAYARTFYTLASSETHFEQSRLEAHRLAFERRDAILDRRREQMEQQLEEMRARIGVGGPVHGSGVNSK